MRSCLAQSEENTRCAAVYHECPPLSSTYQYKENEKEKSNVGIFKTKD